MRPFSYQVPPGGADSAGLEGFLVYAADADEPVGKVGIVLEREGTTRKAWVFAFLVLPVGLAAATCVALYSAARRPYERC